MDAHALVFGAIAVLATLLVLALVLRPLWRAPAGRVAGLGLVGGLAVTALALYALVGTPGALDPATRQAPETLDAAIAQLQQQLQREPQSVEGWRLLGRALASAQQPAESRDAYARAAALAPDEADVLVEAAEARALAATERRFDARAIAWLERALAVQPAHQRARWFLGIAQRQAGDAAAAARTWEPLLAQVDATTAGPLREQIALAREEAGLPPLDGTTAPVPVPGKSLRVHVSLDPQLAQRIRLDGNASIFVIARGVDGSPVPVAAEKHAVSELPFTTVLDDGDSLMPTQVLSALPEVLVSARLSRSGDATAQPGDLRSPAVRVAVPADAPVSLVIGAGYAPDPVP
jgi:cytochrome c-type biogenesis protein CcmH